MGKKSRFLLAVGGILLLSAIQCIDTAVYSSCAESLFSMTHCIAANNLVYLYHGWQMSFEKALLHIPLLLFFSCPHFVVIIILFGFY